MGEIIYKDLCYQINGAIFEVYNTLGFGHKENVYQKALAQEFTDRKIPFEKEKSLPVTYKNIEVGKYRPDFVVDNKIIIELKSVSFVTKDMPVQLGYYLKGTNFRLGLLVNFGSSRLEIIRRVWG